MNGNQVVQYDAPRNMAVDTPDGFIFVPWTRRQLAAYRMEVLGWSQAAAWQFAEHSHNIRKESE